MSFFEEFKRGASDVANKAVKKTGEFTNIAKLNINVKTNEAKLSSVFEEIGFMFYEAQCTGADHTSDIASLIMKADKIKSDIENTKKEIAKLKKVVVCTGCGSEVSDESAFCSHCGAKIEKPEPECCCGCEEADEAEYTEECDCGCCEETAEEECCCGCCEETEETPECTEECDCDCCEETAKEECDCGCCDNADETNE